MKEENFILDAPEKEKSTNGSFPRYLLILPIYNLFWVILYSFFVANTRWFWLYGLGLAAITLLGFFAGYFLLKLSKSGNTEAGCIFALFMLISLFYTLLPLGVVFS